MSLHVPFGSPLPLTVSLPDGDAAMFPQARVFNLDTGLEVAGSPFSLAHVANGRYTSVAFTPSNANARYEAHYLIYSDAGHTTFSGKYGRPTDRFDVDNVIFEIEDMENTIWDADLIDHVIVGSMGEAMNDFSNITPTGLASAVWDALVINHTVPASFGEYVQVIRQSAFEAVDELTDPTWGLDMILANLLSQGVALTTEINQNETKIDAIIPAVNAAKVAVIAEVDQNEIKINALSPALVALQAALKAEIDQNEVKIDALSGQVGAIQNNTTVRFVVPDRLIKPDAGNKTYQFHLRLFDELGNPEAPDSVPTIRIRRLDTPADVVSGALMTQDGVKVGAYFYDFTISAGTNEYQALVEATVVENGVTRYIPALTEVTEFESDLNAIEAAVAAVDAKTTIVQSEVQNPTYGLQALKTGQTAIVSEVNQNESKIDAVKAKTDTIPANTATQANVAAVGAQVAALPLIGTIQTRLDLLRDNLKGLDGRDLTQVYDVFDLTPVAKTTDPRFAFLDAAISSRSTLAAAQVWSYATRELTAIQLPTLELDKIWEYPASQVGTVGSMGKIIKDNLDATVSSRAQMAPITSALAGVAQEATLLGVQSALTTEDNQNEVKINTLLSELALVKAKTNNIPASPAQQGTLTTAEANILAALAAVDLKATGIKSKTDNIPASPATQGAVLSIPTNPVLATDPRLSNLDATVSSRSTLSAASLTPLATGAQVASSQSAIITQVNQNETKIDTIDLRTQNIKAKTDLIVAGGATEANVDAEAAAILAAIAGIPAGGGLTAAQVWAHATRTLTQAVASPADLIPLAKSSELVGLAADQYNSRMSTVYQTVGGLQEVIGWVEKNGERVLAATNCIVAVKDAAGNLKWTATLASPNADGIFKFTNAISAGVDQNYYVVITITADGNPRTSVQPFFSVG